MAFVKVTDQPGLNNFSGIKDIAADAVVVCRVVNLRRWVVKNSPPPHLRPRLMRRPLLPVSTS